MKLKSEVIEELTSVLFQVQSLPLFVKLKPTMLSFFSTRLTSSVLVMGYMEIQWLLCLKSWIVNRIMLSSIITLVLQSISVRVSRRIRSSLGSIAFTHLYQFFLSVFSFHSPLHRNCQFSRHDFSTFVRSYRSHSHLWIHSR